MVNNRKIGLIQAILSVALLLSCNKTTHFEQDATIRVNTLSINAPAAASSSDDFDNSFVILFWSGYDFLTSPTAENPALWNNPYVLSRAPQPVGFYEHIVYDTDRSYPSGEDDYLYATGFAPGMMLEKDEEAGYRILHSKIRGESGKGRYDFLSCDAWPQVYRGSKSDPFSQEKNRLYFRHLSSKLVFYADRDAISMENRQYVRNVRITNLQKSTDGGMTWGRMFTPSDFEWTNLASEDYTLSYTKIIDKVIAVNGASAAGTRPVSGYRVTGTAAFAGANSRFVLSRNNMDLVPVDGLVVDSCFVCNEIRAGNPVTGAAPLQLKMDISAELSFDKNFPLPDNESITDDMTFTREWHDVIVDRINAVDEYGIIVGNAAVNEFKPGCEYRIYITFNRSGVNLSAIEQEWNYGGMHYIPIVGK